MNILQKVYHIYSNSDKNSEYQGQDASDLIKAELLENKPSMIARLGSTELQAIAYYIKCRNSFRRPVEQLMKSVIFNKMWSLSGFYPSNERTIGQFSEMMIEDAKEVDILGTWRKEEIYLKEELKNAKKVRLKDLEPYYHQFPYTEVFKGKKILVIHPFEKSIKQQYTKHRLLFNNPLVLPEFELKTIKAVQSIANNTPEFADWFKALESMKYQIDQIKFDIAIIGCGAYGFPLAAHVKRSGKKAILLGGAVQTLFGIKGKRWEKHPFISQLMNEHWCRPDVSEVPKNATKVDGGSYW